MLWLQIGRVIVYGDTINEGLEIRHSVIQYRWGPFECGRKQRYRRRPHHINQKAYNMPVHRYADHCSNDILLLGCKSENRAVNEIVRDCRFKFRISGKEEVTDAHLWHLFSVFELEWTRWTREFDNCGRLTFWQDVWYVNAKQLSKWPRLMALLRIKEKVLSWNVFGSFGGIPWDYGCYFICYQTAFNVYNKTLTKNMKNKWNHALLMQMMLRYSGIIHQSQSRLF
jgi:hypothetical protein